MLSLSTIGAVATTTLAYLLKMFIDALVKKDSTQIYEVAVAMGVTYFLSYLAGYGAFMQRMTLEERMGLMLDRHLLELSTKLPGIEHHERADYVKEMELLQQQRVTLSQTAGSVFEVLSSVVQFALTLALLGHLHPLLLVLPLFGAPTLWAGKRATGMTIANQEALAETYRLFGELYTIGTTAGPAKELRIFGLQSEIVKRHLNAVEYAGAQIRRTKLLGALLNMAGWIVFALGFVGAILFVVVRAVHHQATIGDVVLALSLAQRINHQVDGFVGTTAWMFQTLKAADRYLWLEKYANEILAAPRSVEARAVPSRLEQGVRFEHVTFRYPGTDTDVLTDVTVDLPAGATVAIVGDNGAGKTTFVKLLCRFYEPTSGRILVDGIDIRAFDIDEWRARSSGAFQDFSRFELLARETVGVGDLPQIDDEPTVIGALGRAGASELPGLLPAGLATQVGKSFEDGHELSEGQWQKLALGRAMMREEPLVLVLDEPTASLDAPTEHALFERYAGAARSTAKRAGAITVLVSHRFSTVRMADVIVVVDGGRVVESGAHPDLITQAGLYAELYELQARAYR